MSEEEKPIGDRIDELYALRAERLELSKKVDELKSQESKLRGIIIAQLRTLQLDGGKGKAANATITTAKQARIDSWPDFWNYCVKNDAHDLVQKRVAITAVRARWEEGEVVDGISPFDVDDISLTKR